MVDWLNKILPKVLPTKWIIPVAMGTWAVWTWSKNFEETRQQERTMMAALYVNPFLAACEDLQSRIYNLLEHRGIRTIGARYSDGSYAEEIVYLIVRYFGWYAAVCRYGPYTQDPVVIRCGEGVRSAFATSRFRESVGPFNFFTAKQRAFGKMVMRRIEGQYGVELDTITFYEFKNRLAFPPFSNSQSLQQSIEALRNVEDFPGLPTLAGRERLRKAQNHLVNLLNYVEAREGFSLFAGKRKKCSRLGRPETAVGPR